MPGAYTRRKLARIKILWPKFPYFGKLFYFCHALVKNKPEGIAQLVRALDCGSRGRRFEPGYPPLVKACAVMRGLFLFLFLPFRPSNNGSQEVSLCVYLIYFVRNLPFRPSNDGSQSFGEQDIIIVFLFALKHSFTYTYKKTPSCI